ncbi:kynureninase [Pholiota conissans]|uniref:Kynureninase n=1 Tax=Pholiota conissans TaxID=109636 RepID=A0A9P6CXB5_9AGAR|nr:kynureninase [Pholiota conissans]
MTDLNVPLSDDFIVPINRDVGATLRTDGENHCTYLCGNSLGLQSKTSAEFVQEELHVWATRGVIGHFSHPHNRPWTKCCDDIHPLLAELLGANEMEVACMGTLTNNLHLMMDSFYKPTQTRFKILCEVRAFPSDQYAFASQALAHGLDPATAILEVSPREGEFTLRAEDILDIIDREGNSIALVLFSGVQYYTGQWFPMEVITKKAKAMGCVCGWDLAHAAGNVPLSLHDWDVDFAVLCTYKYINSGPGGIAALFVHEKWHEVEKPKFAGWWGHELSTRFAMPPTFSPIRGAQGFQQSNPSALTVAALLGALTVIKKAGMMPRLRERSVQLTGALEKLLKQSQYFVPPSQIPQNGTKIGFTIITPEEPSARGAQLSLLFLPLGSETMRIVHDYLLRSGVIGDEREPDVIRLAPAPLYNTLKDCEHAAEVLETGLIFAENK